MTKGQLNVCFAVALAALTALTSSIVAAEEVTFPPGSRFGIQAASGYVALDNFAGFTNPGNGAVIVFNEFPLSVYTGNTAEQMKEQFQQRGYKIGQYRRLGNDQVECMVLSGEHETLRDTPVEAHIAFCGGEAFSAMIQFMIPKSAVTVADREAVFSMVRSVKERRMTLAQQVDELPFALGTLAGMKPILVTLGTLVALAGERARPDGKSGAPGMMINYVRNTDALSDDELIPAATHLMQQHRPEASIVASRVIEISGARATEVVARQKADEDRETVIYYWVRVGSDNLLVYIGETDDEHEQADVAIFRKVVESVSLK